MNISKENSIGVFDSGVGGVGVLKELVQILPNENYIYYGDSLNAPYGEKTPEQVFELVHNVFKYLLSQNVKAIVIACNTATSVAVSTLREMYPEISIIGMEPAIKKAISEDKRNKVLVMATPMTLKLEKYLNLQQQLETKADYINVACPGLAKRIESMNFEDDDLKNMLRELLEPYKGKVDNIVLGCTHYPFIKKQIKEIMGDIPLIDGGKGTSLQVQRVLKAKGLLNDQTQKGKIVFESSKSTEEELSIYKQLFELYEI
mgnify:CR=1 FL=1